MEIIRGVNESFTRLPTGLNTVGNADRISITDMPSRFARIYFRERISHAKIRSRETRLGILKYEVTIRYSVKILVFIAF